MEYQKRKTSALLLLSNVRGMRFPDASQPPDLLQVCQASNSESEATLMLL